MQLIGTPAHIIDSMSVCTRMPGTLTSTSCPIQWDTTSKGRGVVGIGEAEELIRDGRGGGLAAAGAGRDEQMGFFVLPVGDPFPAGSFGPYQATWAHPPAPPALARFDGYDRAGPGGLTLWVRHKAGARAGKCRDKNAFATPSLLIRPCSRSGRILLSKTNL